jgi:hypothetical protein
MNPPIDRRYFLRGTGAMIALPALESLGFRRHASAAPVAMPPKRVVFLGIGWGVTQETWFPDTNQTGAGYTLPPGLAPLARHKADFTVVQGCSHRSSNEAHWGSTFWLTGANRYAVPGRNFSNTISADQVAARQLGQGTRFASIQLDSDDGNSGHGPGRSLAWDHHGKPLAGPSDPLQLFHRLFSADELSLEERKAAIAARRSVLDAVLTDAKRVQRGLTKTDSDKLSEYFEGIRSIEQRLDKDEQWLAIPKSKPPLPEPSPGLKGRAEIEIMYDLIVAALLSDSTRVMTYRQPVTSLLNSLGIRVNPHDMSHYTPGERMEAAQKRDLAQSELLAGLFDKLKATKEADGSSLFDHVALAYGTNIRSIHYLDNCPTIVSGRGASLTLGHNIVLPKDTPLCNVWLTMLRGAGVAVDRHGDSTGVVPELLA